MARIRKILRYSFGLVAVGYLLGLLTAPRSGKQTRNKLKQTSESAVPDVEKELKNIYDQTKKALDKLAKDNQEITAKLKTTKVTAQKSQEKVKELLSAIHGQDRVDEDLEAALKDAKSSLKELKNYITKL